MTYEGQALQVDHSGTLPHGGRVPLWTWQMVQERMADAMRHWWRSHDSDARFGLGGRISSVWQQCVDDQLALIERVGVETEAPRALPLSRGDMARMVEASEWLAHVREEDRRLVVVVLVYLAKGEKKVPWLKLVRRLGVQHGADGLRKRYSRAITDVANVLNGGKARRESVNPPTDATQQINSVRHPARMG
jgi:hypothetical protein